MQYRTFEELKDSCADPVAFLEEIVAKSKGGDWKARYFALDDLRMLSKYHFEFLQTRIVRFVPFVVGSQQLALHSF